MLALTLPSQERTFSFQCAIVFRMVLSGMKGENTIAPFPCQGKSQVLLSQDSTAKTQDEQR